MPSHQIRVRQNNCEHHFNLGRIYYNQNGIFVVDCTKCNMAIPIRNIDNWKDKWKGKVAIQESEGTSAQVL